MEPSPAAPPAGAATPCIRAIKTGAVTVIQRFNSAVDLSVHYHALFLDGVYSLPPGREPVFHPTPDPNDEDVARRGRGLPPEPSDRRRRDLSPAPSYSG